MLKSAFNFYPGIQVIIADDTPAEAFELVDKKKYPTVKHYMMPEYSGWFAGRALAISQVTTEYFLWVDDDFVFQPNTNLEWQLNVIRTTGYDVIGGGVGMAGESGWARKRNLNIAYGADGNCYARQLGKVIPLPGYEKDCHVADIISNFFIARTITAGTVRMDPMFNQIAHREFFLDAIGKLRIGM